MKYPGIVPAVFIRRPNRFLARVLVAGAEETVHIRNTGRLRELLVPGASVLLAPAAAAGRKTAYTLVAVYKGEALVNIDSLAPNHLAAAALAAGRLEGLGPVAAVRREVSYGGSRFDLGFTAEDRAGFIEVKGVTLERDGVAMFPDAPTSRGARHLHELADAAARGYACHVIFIIQLGGVRAFRPNAATDPAFAAALRSAAAGGVGVHAYDCMVTPGRTVLGDPVEVIL